MRFKIDEPLTEKDYFKDRAIEKFLWFPKKIGKEIRWLERATIRQIVLFKLIDDPDEIFSDYRKPKLRVYYWQDLEWMDDENGGEDE